MRPERFVESSHHAEPRHSLLHSRPRRWRHVESVSGWEAERPWSQSRSAWKSGVEVAGSPRSALPRSAHHAVSCHRWLYSAPGIFFTVSLAVDLEVSVVERHPAVAASEAPNVMLALRLVFEILPLDTPGAASAYAPVKSVVVHLAVRAVVQDVEC